MAGSLTISKFCRALQDFHKREENEPYNPYSCWVKSVVCKESRLSWKVSGQETNIMYTTTSLHLYIHMNVLLHVGSDPSLWD